jgi:mannose-1-phosphate guanylyltransferase/phosphomannomutase
MKGVIMAGGFGTRLRPLTFSLPKPMVPVANRPIMQRIVELLKAHGITDHLALLYYQPEAIKDYFGDGSKLGVKMGYVGAEGDLGTAGSVKLGQPSIGKDRFMVISADILTDFDLTAAIQFHEQNKSKATLVLTRVENPLQFGVVITAKDGRITRFLEKPSWGEVFSDTINTGIYILEPEVLDLIPEGREFDFSKDLFPMMLEKGMPLFGYIAPGYWKDVGTLNEYLNVHRDILAGKVEAAVDGVRKGRLGTDIWQGEGTAVDPSAKLSNSVILGRNCKIGPRAELTDCILGDGCIVAEGARIQGAVLWDGVQVGAGAELKECTIAGKVRIGQRSAIDVGAVIADDCRIGDDCRLKAESKMWPHKQLDNGAILSSSLVWGDKWSSTLFDAYGISGMANTEITPEFATKLGAAYGASLALGSTVLVTRDAHKTSRMLDRALMSGMLAAGVNVYDLRLQPIPVTRYVTKALKAAGGLHVRRSPIEKKIQDIKFFDESGLDLATKKEKAIENLFYREDFRRAESEQVGEISFPARGIDHYLEGFFHSVDQPAIRERRFKIVVDYAFGSATGVFPSLLGKLGAEVVSLNAFVDETKMTRSAEEFQAALKQLGSIVPTLNADFGVMLDAGAQKIFISDEKGTLVGGDQAVVLFTLLHALAVPGAKVAVPVTATRAVEEVAAKHGATVTRCGTTYRSMMEAADKGASFVGEERGGFIFGQFFPAFDAMMATVKLMEYLAAAKQPLSELLKQVPKIQLLRSEAPCPWEKKGQVMRNLMEEADMAGSKAELIDGVKLHTGKSWVLILPDGDKPYFHVDAEADTEREAQALVDKYHEKIKQWQQA